MATPGGEHAMEYRAAIVGCGRIAGQMDDDPRRRDIWTHAGAYTAVPCVALVAAADIDPIRLETFGKRWQVPALYDDYHRLLAAEQPDILSICTHSALHEPVARAGIEAGVKAIFCEKPMAATLAEADRMVTMCQARGVVLAVNHTRRWDETYRQVKTLLDAGHIGALQGIMASYTGGVANMGSHLFDLLRFLGGDVCWVRADTTTDARRQDPDLSGSLAFADGLLCHVHGCEQQNYLLLELDLLGTCGRMRVSHNGARVELWRAQESQRYTGYRELAPEMPPALPAENRRMVQAVEDIIACLETGGVPRCSGHDGRAALELVAAFCQSYAAGGERVVLPLQERAAEIHST